MAFWGIEVKSGRSITHSSRESGGRLRISQATLGFGDATKKSVIQCNVGDRSPVLLCVLIPNQTESCHLDLEFEETDDVVFSVLGPRSVYLTGYYVRPFSKSNAQSETESHGEDIENTQTESSFRSDDDAYEDSFIDDNELQVSSPSHVSGNKVVDVTEDDEFRVKKGRSKRLVRKYQIFDSDSESNNSQQENGYFKSKGVAETFAKEEKSPVKNKPKKSLDNVEEITVKEVSAVNKAHKNKNVNDQVQPLNQEKWKKKRKSSSKDEISGEVESDEHPYVLIKDKGNMLHLRETGTKPLVPPSESGAENRGKSKKRRKESHLDGVSQEKDSLKNDIAGETDLACHKGASDLLADGDQPEKKTKKRTKKISADTNSTQQRTLSNGLIIEDIAFGPVDGNEAVSGKRVKIFFTAMSKENGRVFDSNIGKVPYKFRLGSKGNTDGWKYGITGMRIGDKRRLIVPPSLGCGEDGAGENVPPNSWLVYEVELVDVHK